ncbi:hypothetical protein GIB67_002056 [Kingdonia uniflora]|uniref:Uncharacterized protein n=1 Tax=Kingdonia uniflora TaxID=39325 RepID=A0A7J7KWA0_9MAGN|nr:hypothetical protein GIB67_002056 [Kingdonia uniflora]
MTEDIEDRLVGVPVYTLSNTAEEFVLVSNESRGKSLGLFCFKKEDAESLLEQKKEYGQNHQILQTVVCPPCLRDGRDSVKHEKLSILHLATGFFAKLHTMYSFYEDL